MYSFVDRLPNEVLMNLIQVIQSKRNAIKIGDYQNALLYKNLEKKICSENDISNDFRIKSDILVSLLREKIINNILY